MYVCYVWKYSVVFFKTFSKKKKLFGGPCTCSLMSTYLLAPSLENEWMKRSKYGKPTLPECAVVEQLSGLGKLH